MDVLQCHICSSLNLKDYMLVNAYRICQCRDCSHIQVIPIPDDKTLLSMYQHNHDDSFYGNSCSVTLLEKSNIDASYLINYYSERLDLINGILPAKSENILDFGCTNGVFVKSIVDSGFKNAQGYDVAEELVAAGIKNGLNLHTGDMTHFCASFSNYFDLILSYHVFEHLPAPRHTLSELYKCLKDGAYIYVNVPHINSLQVRILGEKSAIIDPPFHLHYFTKQSLTRLFKEQGFEIIKVETPFWEKSTDTYLALKGCPAFIAVLLRYLVAPVRGMIKWWSLGGTITVLAKKAELH